MRKKTVRCDCFRRRVRVDDRVVEQVSSLGPKGTDNHLIVCAFFVCIYLCIET